MDDIDRKYSHLRRESRAKLRAAVADGQDAYDVDDYAEALKSIEAAQRRIRERGLVVEPDPGG